ncbi:hypothetical protein D3C80_1361920 [compost metagenome]
MIKAMNQEIADDMGGEGSGVDKIEIALQQCKTNVILYGERLEMAPLHRSDNRAGSAGRIEHYEAAAALYGGQGARLRHARRWRYRLLPRCLAASQQIFPKVKVITAEEPVVSNAVGVFYAAAQIA